MKTLTLALLLLGAGLAVAGDAKPPQAGDQAPAFSLQGSDGRNYTLADFKGKKAVVIAWFPKAFTGGCTAECKSLRATGAGIRAFDVAYFAASVDDAETNKKFAESLGLDFPILSDPAKETARAYGVLQGDYAARHTFYIGKDGRILLVDREVKPPTAGEDVARHLTELKVAHKAGVGSVQDLTRGSIARHLAGLSAFIAVSMLFQTLYFLADLYFVGRLGKEAIAAVGFAGNLMMVVLAITQMLAVGTTTLVSHAVGQKDRARACLVFNQAFCLSIAVGLGTSAAAFVLRGPYCRFLGADGETARLGVQYLDWFIPALFLQYAVVAMGAALRGTGVIKPTMVIQVVTVLINIALAPVLILGWGTGRPLGVAGAALASLLAIGIGVALFWGYFLRPGMYLTFSAAHWRPRAAILGSLMRIGLPAGGEFALMSTYLVLIYWITSHLGAAAQAGFGIGGRVMQSMFLPVMAIAFAAAPLAGQNFGARDAARVRQTFRTAAIQSSLCMLALTAVSHVAPEAFIRIFSSEPDVVAFGAQFLRIISWNFLAMGLIFTSASMFQGMGHTLPPLLSSLLRLLLFALPALLLSLRPGFDIRWVWYLSVGSVAVQAIVNLILLRREFAVRLAFAPAAAATAP